MRTNIYLRFGGVVVISVISVCPIVAKNDSRDSFLDAESIVDAWESTYISIKSMRVSYNTVLIDYQSPARDPNASPPSKGRHVERVEEGKRFHIRFSNAEDGFEKPESLIEQAFDGKTTWAYWGQDTHGTIHTGLTGRGVETENDLKVYMFLETWEGRVGSKFEFLNGQLELAVKFRKRFINGGITVRPKLEYVSDQLCHVVELVTTALHRTDEGQIEEGQSKEVFWMAHEKGMCVMKYQTFWDDTILAEMEVREIAAAEMDGTTVWYPQKVNRTYFPGDSEVSKYETKVTEFIPNIDVSDDIFRIDFPPGTDVHDRVLGLSYVVGGAKPEGEVPHDSVVETVDEAQLQNETDKQRNSVLEEQEIDTQQLTDNDKDEEDDVISEELMTQKNKVHESKTFLVIGIVVFVIFGLFFWYKRPL